ncbi:MAG: T9SS type A sorting domain-containing protein [Ferruginibacter sp.]
MKKILVIKTLIVALCLGAITNTSSAQNDADPAITSLSFGISPVSVDQTTTLTVFFTNGGFTTSIPAGSVGLNISLPTSGEYIASPESVSALSGSFLSKFNWTYNVANKNFFGISNQAIPPGDGGTVVILVKGVIPVSSRISVANIIRLNPGDYPNENTNNNNLTASLGVTAGGPVPIKLLSFNAVKQNKTVYLSWETATELNSSHFDVQTSRNGTDWQSIGTIAAAGNSNTTQRYSYVHSSPGKGINYYRLKEVDIDAKFEYSMTRTISFSTSSAITISPNPTTDKVFITSGNTGTVQLALYSTEGKVMQTFKNFVLGNSIDMSGYAAGIYLLKITGKDDNTEVMRIVKK